MGIVYCAHDDGRCLLVGGGKKTPVGVVVVDGIAAGVGVEIKTEGVADGIGT